MEVKIPTDARKQFMKAYLICFFLFITHSVEAQFEKAVLLDKHKGLMGSDIKLGMKLKDIPNLKESLSLDIEKNKWYEREPENLNFYGVKFEYIRYRVVNNKVVEIVAKYNEEVKDSVMLYLSKIYGQPARIPVFPNRYAETGWRGNKVLLYEFTKNDLTFIKEEKKGYRRKYLKAQKKSLIDNWDNNGPKRIPLNYKDFKYMIQTRIIVKRIMEDPKENLDQRIKQYKLQLKSYKESKYVK